MPWLTLIHPKGQGSAGQGEMRDRDWTGKWMEQVRENEEGKPGEKSRQQQSSKQKPGEGQSKYMFWSDTQRTLRPWYSFAPVGVVWSVCQLEMLQHPSLSVMDLCCKQLLLCLLWIVLGGCVYALQLCLQPGPTQKELLQRKRQQVGIENQKSQYLWISPTQSTDLHVPLVLALADSLLLCVLQEPLHDPTVPHIEGLLSRLEAVAHTLQKANSWSVAVLEKVDQGSIIEDKPKLIHTYLQQRVETLRALVQVQGDFEVSVNEMLQGLNGLWAQLEELHAGVTLTKREGQGHRDLASAQTDAEFLFAVLGLYSNRLQSCQAHLKDSTQLLQKLTWSHTHISGRVDSSSESVWPELLLQSNIEQFDKVQESFSSLEQQTATFQAHLEGLGKGNQDGHVGPFALANRVHSGSASLQNCHHVSDVSLEELTSADTPLSLCERSALQFSSTIGRLRKSGRRK